MTSARSMPCYNLCGVPFEPRKPNQRFYSEAHRYEAHRRRDRLSDDDREILTRATTLATLPAPEDLRSFTRILQATLAKMHALMQRLRYGKPSRPDRATAAVDSDFLDDQEALPAVDELRLGKG